MARKIYVCCGLSGSGKSSYLKDTPSSDDIVLCRDSFARIYGMDGGVWQEFISEELRKNPNRTIFIDQVTLDLSSFMRLVKNVKWLPGDIIVLLAFHTDIATCRDRVLKREHGTINRGLQYLYKDTCRNNPLISEEEFNEFAGAQQFVGNTLMYKKIIQ